MSEMTNSVDLYFIKLISSKLFFIHVFVLSEKKAKYIREKRAKHKISPQNLDFEHQAVVGIMDMSLIIL